MSTIEEGEPVTVEPQQMKETKIKSLQERLLPRILSQAVGNWSFSLLFICKYDIKRCIRIFFFFFFELLFLFLLRVCVQRQQRSRESRLPSQIGSAKEETFMGYYKS